MMNFPFMFQFQEDKLFLGPWAKHHQFVGVHAIRAYPETSIPSDILLPGKVGAYAKAHESHLPKKNRFIEPLDDPDGKMHYVHDKYVLYANTSVCPPLTDFHATSHATHTVVNMRFNFLIESDLYILDRELTLTPHYTVSTVVNEIDRLLLETVYDSKNDLNVSGISECINHPDFFTLLVVCQDTGDYRTLDIKRTALPKYLVGFAVYAVRTRFGNIEGVKK